MKIEQNLLKKHKKSRVITDRFKITLGRVNIDVYISNTVYCVRKKKHLKFRCICVR